MKDNATPEHTIGIDLGDARHTICVLNGTGEPVDRRTVTNSQDGLGRLARRYPGARVALEVGNHSPWISRLLGEPRLSIVIGAA